GVGLVEGVPAPVVGQRDDLVLGIEGSVDPERGVAAVAVLVEVVAEVEDRVEVVAGGEVPVGAEPPALVVAAGHHPEAEPLHGRARGRCGAGATHRRRGAEGPEPVPVLGGGAQPGGVDLDRVVPGSGGGDRALGHDRAEVGILGHLPRHLGGRAEARAGRGLVARGDPGPEHDPVRERVAGGHPVAERAGGGLGERRVSEEGGGPGQGERSAAEAELEEASTIHLGTWSQGFVALPASPAAPGRCHASFTPGPRYAHFEHKEPRCPSPPAPSRPTTTSSRCWRPPAGTGWPTGEPSSRCSPAGCRPGAATASSPASGACSTSSSDSASATRSWPSSSGPGSSTTARSSTWPATASAARSSPTGRASCTSRARRSSPWRPPSGRPCCSRRSCCRSSTTTARWPAPPPAWSTWPPAGPSS